jgi:iron complex transport system ATP-binding protein
VVLMSGGRVHASGEPQKVLTPSNLETVYGCPMTVGRVPAGMDFFVLPLINAKQTA